MHSFVFLWRRELIIHLSVTVLELVSMVSSRVTDFGLRESRLRSLRTLIVDLRPKRVRHLRQRVH